MPTEPQAPGADTPEADARAYLAELVRDPEARPADRLRAAEAILRATPEGRAPQGLGRDLDDAALLALARGEGGRPPLMGPAMGVTETGPIHAVAEGAPKSGTPFPSAGGPRPAILENGPPAPVPFPDADEIGDPISGAPAKGTPAPRSNSSPIPSISVRKPKRIAKGKQKDDDVDPCS